MLCPFGCTWGVFGCLGCWSMSRIGWRLRSSRRGGGRGAGIAGSAAARCGTGGPSVSVIWRCRGGARCWCGAGRRFWCANCEERHLEDHDLFQAGLTRRFARQLVEDARVMSIRAVSRRHGVGWHRIMGLVKAHSDRMGQRRRLRPTRVLLVDETSIRRRHRYVTVVACGDTKQVLAMIPGRTKGSLSRFFREQGPRWCRGVEIVVSDGSRSYQAAISEYLPDARHVLDRFHVVRWFTEGLTLVRRELQRRDPDHRPPAFEPDLFRARFTLLRRADRLTEAHQAHLDQLFDAYPRLRTAWDALQQLYQLYEADDLEGANQALARFADLYATGRIPRIPRRGRHHHFLGRRNPGLPHQPTSHQRTHRRHQQPPPSPTTSRPRLHQLPKLRSQRTPCNMTPTPTTTPETHDFAQPHLVGRRVLSAVRLHPVDVIEAELFAADR